MALTTRYGFADIPLANAGNPVLGFTDLSASMTSGATTCTVVDASGFPAAVEFDVIIGLQVGGVWTNVERAHCTNLTGSTLTLTRSGGVSHAAGEHIALEWTANGAMYNPGVRTDAGDMDYLAANGRPARLAAPSDGDYVMRWASGVPSWQTAGVGAGTVTSVALTVPNILSVAGSPVTTSGTLAVSLATQTANTVFAGPATGSAATPTFRSLVAADIPSLSSVYLPVASFVPASPTDSIQYNNAGAFGGSAKLTFDGTRVFLGDPTANFDAYIQGWWGTPPLLVNALDPVTNGSIATVAQKIGHTFSPGVTDDPKSIHGFSTLALSDNPYGGEVVAYLAHAKRTFDAGGSFFDSSGYGLAVSLGTLPSAGAGGDLYGIKVLTPDLSGGTLTTLYAYHSVNLAGDVTHPYYLWFDSRGVYRIREDNVADGSGNPQAIPSLYNPRFAKYVAGATDYERGVEQWVANVYQIGTEAGAGSSVLRGVKIIGASLDTPATLTANGVAVATASSSTAFTNKTGNISQWTNDSGYLTSVTAHNLLSATHGDTTAGTVARGDLITGQGASAKWVRLAKGTANQVLAMDGTATDIVWATVASGAAWGAITGTLSDQTDLQTALNARLALTGGTMTGTITSTIGTITASTPVLTATQTWNSSGVTFDGLKLNVTRTASADASKLLELQNGGTSVFAVNIRADNFANPTLQLGGDTTTGWYRNAGGQWTWAASSNPTLSLITNQLRVGPSTLFCWAASGNSTVGGDTGLTRAGASIMGLTNAGSGGAAIDFTEMTAPAAGATNHARLYAQDNGSGKTQLMVIFPTGAAIPLATEA